MPNLYVNDDEIRELYPIIKNELEKRYIEEENILMSGFERFFVEQHIKLLENLDKKIDKLKKKLQIE